MAWFLFSFLLGFVAWEIGAYIQAGHLSEILSALAVSAVFWIGHFTGMAREGRLL